MNKKLLLTLGTLTAIGAPIAAVVSCGKKGAVEGAKNVVLVYYDTQRNKPAQINYWKAIVAEYNKTNISKKMKLQVAPFDRIQAISQTVNTWGAISSNTPDLLIGEPLNAFQLDSDITKYAKRFTVEEVMEIVKGGDYKGDGSEITKEELAEFGWVEYTYKKGKKKGEKYYNAVPFGKAGQILLYLQPKQKNSSPSTGTLLDTLQGAAKTKYKTEKDLIKALETGDVLFGQDGIKPSETLIQLGAGWMAAPWLTASFQQLQPTGNKTYDDGTKLYGNVNDVIYGATNKTGTHITEKSDGSGAMHSWYTDTIDNIYSAGDALGKLGFSTYKDSMRKNPPVNDVFQTPYIEEFFSDKNTRNFHVADISHVAQIEAAFNESKGKINKKDYELKAVPLPKQWKFNGKAQDLLTPHNTLQYFVNNRAWGFKNTVKQAAIKELLGIVNSPEVALAKYAAGYIPFNKGAVNKIINDSSNLSTDIQKRFLVAKGTTRGKTADGKSRDFRYQMGHGLSFGNYYYTNWSNEGWWASNTFVAWQDKNNNATVLDEEVNLSIVDNAGKVLDTRLATFKTFTQQLDEVYFLAGQFRNKFKNSIAIARATSE